MILKRVMDIEMYVLSSARRGMNARATSIGVGRRRTSPTTFPSTVQRRSQKMIEKIVFGRSDLVEVIAGDGPSYALRIDGIKHLKVR